MTARDRHIPWWDLEWQRAADHDYLDSVRYQRDPARRGQIRDAASLVLLAPPR